MMDPKMMKSQMNMINNMSDEQLENMAKMSGKFIFKNRKITNKRNADGCQVFSNDGLYDAKYG